jgi:hypothetical protein
MKLSLSISLAVYLTVLTPPALADEAGFLKSLGGAWSGKGTVLMRIGSSPLNVSCNFDNKAMGTSLAMAGTCRGLLVVRRTVSANMTATGARYHGTYRGPMGMTSTLSGRRDGQSIILAVRWARETNGDRSAQMTIERIGIDGMRLRTIDKDLKTGKTVVTSDIRLSR